MRKGRNSGLQKEQKEKHMVCHWLTISSGTLAYPYSGVFLYIGSYIIVSLFLSLFGLQEHRQTHGNTREPLLENITSDYDLELFRKAQARASEDLVLSCCTSPINVTLVSNCCYCYILQYFLSWMTNKSQFSAYWHNRFCWTVAQVDAMTSSLTPCLPSCRKSCVSRVRSPRAATWSRPSCLAATSWTPGTTHPILRSMHVWVAFTSVNSASSTWRARPSSGDTWWAAKWNFTIHPNCWAKVLLGFELYNRFFCFVYSWPTELWLMITFIDGVWQRTVFYVYYRSGLLNTTFQIYIHTRWVLWE